MTALPNLPKLKKPTWRYEAAINLGSDRASDDAYIQSLANYMADPESDSILAEAHLLYVLPQSRSVLSSLLLSGADCPKIASYIGSTEAVVLAFSKLFFDMSVFPNRLVVKDYIDSLPESSSQEKNHKALLRSAYILGDRYIAWKMSLVISDPLQPDEVNTSLLEDSYWRSREHKPYSVDDPRAKESKSWVPQALRTLSEVTGSRSSGETGLDSLRLRLVKVDNTLSKDSLLEDIKG